MSAKREPAKRPQKAPFGSTRGRRRRRRRPCAARAFELPSWTGGIEGLRSHLNCKSYCKASRSTARTQKNSARSPNPRRRGTRCASRTCGRRCAEVYLRRTSGRPSLASDPPVPESPRAAGAKQCRRRGRPRAPSKPRRCAGRLRRSAAKIGAGGNTRRRTFFGAPRQHFPKQLAQTPTRRASPAIRRPRPQRARGPPSKAGAGASSRVSGPT
mmetsp:Transcript_25701/g.86371  ORF Transcript_25701/g.86371 Transcript_25701/m.86371 type:complete len:213 (-) Transcript_25701:158-796(-)